MLLRKTSGKRGVSLLRYKSQLVALSCHFTNALQFSDVPAVYRSRLNPSPMKKLHRLVELVLPRNANQNLPFLAAISSASPMPLRSNPRQSAKNRQRPALQVIPRELIASRNFKRFSREYSSGILILPVAVSQKGNRPVPQWTRNSRI
jgi:hypothetical protein